MQRIEKQQNQQSQKIFEKNIDKTLAKLTKKEIEKTQVIKIRKERGDIATALQK